MQTRQLVLFALFIRVFSHKLYVLKTILECKFPSTADLTLQAKLHVEFSSQFTVSCDHLSGGSMRHVQPGKACSLPCPQMLRPWKSSSSAGGHLRSSHCASKLQIPAFKHAAAALAVWPGRSHFGSGGIVLAKICPHVVYAQFFRQVAQGPRAVANRERCG